jgi:hypothetical protein
MKYRFGMPWYGWLLLFLFLVIVPPFYKSVTAPLPAKKDNLERKQKE